MPESREGVAHGAVTKNVIDVPWFLATGHTPNALSKRLVGPADVSSKVSYVISTYAPGDSAAPHKHKIREQVYHILQGDGVMLIDGVRHRVGPNDVVFLPAGVEHGIANEGTVNLTFVIASGPAEDR